MFKNLVRLSLRATCRRHLNQYKYYHNFSIIKRLYSNNNGNIDNEKIKSNLINILRKIEHPSNKDKDIVYLGLIKKININNNKNNNDNYIISIDLELDRYFREIKKI